MARSDDAAIQLRIEAQLNQLEKAFKKANGIVDVKSKAMEKRAKAMADKIEKDTGKVDIGRAFAGAGGALAGLNLPGAGAAVGGITSLLDLLKDVGGQSEETGTDVTGLADSMPMLGRFALVGAAGVAALAAALNGAHEAMQFADEIGDTAGRLHVTTDALQEYRYAVMAAGGETAGADQALEAFSETLGNAQNGFSKALKAFETLGITKAQVMSFKDAGEALEVVRGKLVGMSDAQRDAAMSKLGLSGMKELLSQSVEEQDKLIRKAHEMGIVMDRELVERGGELNDEFDTLSKAIDVQLKSALIDIGPILVGLMEWLQKGAKWAAEIGDGLRAVPDKTEEGLLKSRAKKVANIESIKSRGPEAVKAASAYIAQTEGFIANIDAEIARRQEARAAGAGVGSGSGAGAGSGGGGRKSAPRDDTDNLDRAVDNAMAAAQRDLLGARMQLTDAVTARAELEGQRLQAERDAAATEHSQLVKQIEAGNSRNKTDELRKANEAYDIQQQAFAIRQRGIEADAQIEMERQKTERQNAIDQALLDELGNRLQIADLSREERTAMELRMQALRKGITDRNHATDRFGDNARLSALTGAAVTDIGPDKVQQASDQAAMMERNRILHEGRSAMDKYFDSLGNMSDYMENQAVDALDSFNQGLVDIGINGGKGIDVLRSALSRFLSGMMNSGMMTLEKAGWSFVSSLWGGGGGAKPKAYAGGTDFHPGGLAMVGERGPELLNLPRGAQVFTAQDTRGMLRGGGGQAPVINQTINLYAQGAVLADTIIDKARAEGVQIGVQAAQGGAQLSRADQARSVRRAL